MRRTLKLKLTSKQLNIYNYLSDTMNMDKSDLFEYVLAEWADLQNISMPNKIDTAKKFHNRMKNNDKLVKVAKRNFDRIVRLFYLLQDVGDNFKGSTVGKE